MTVAEAVIEGESKEEIVFPVIFVIRHWPTMNFLVHWYYVIYIVS